MDCFAYARNDKYSITCTIYHSELITHGFYALWLQINLHRAAGSVRRMGYHTQRMKTPMSISSFFSRTVLALTAIALLSAMPAAFAADSETHAAVKTEQKTEAKPAALTAADKDAAIKAADKIGAFEADKLVGAPTPWQTYFQPSATPVSDQLEGLHDFVFVIICVITAVVTALLAYICIRFSAKNNPKPHRFSHNTTVEVVWTVIPILILIAIGIPSVRTHYKYVRNQTIINNADITLKVTGHQWYWSYEYPDMGISFDSNITKEADLKPGEPRLLAVDNPIVVPLGKSVRVQITSADVIHAWVMPSFGVDQAAVPGRLNETWFKAEKLGIFYGQCQQLCGKYHGFMPIMIKVVTPEEFDIWVKGAKQKFADNQLQQFAALN